MRLALPLQLRLCPAWLLLSSFRFDCSDLALGAAAQLCCHSFEQQPANLLCCGGHGQWRPNDAQAGEGVYLFSTGAKLLPDTQILPQHWGFNALERELGSDPMAIRSRQPKLATLGSLNGKFTWRYLRVGHREAAGVLDGSASGAIPPTSGQLLRDEGQGSKARL